LPMLIKLTIHGSPQKRLTLQEVCEELAKRLLWFREHMNETVWKNSIRHNLWLHQVFKKIQRPITQP
ncbi:hypothetical protein B0H13DRAFT_1462436, partial [Mycena leptocephala]